MLYNHSFSHEIFTVQVVHSVISISVIFKINKTEAIFQVDFTEVAISFEEPFDISLRCSA